MGNITPKSSGNIADSFSGNATTTHTKTTGDWRSLAVINDGASDITFTVNNITVTVKPNETFDDDFESFNSVLVTTTVAYRLVCRE
jgi:hypothetical protein